jgi:hypothetical protein
MHEIIGKVPTYGFECVRRYYEPEDDSVVNSIRKEVVDDLEKQIAAKVVDGFVFDEEDIGVQPVDETGKPSDDIARLVHSPTGVYVCTSRVLSSGVRPLDEVVSDKSVIERLRRSVLLHLFDNATRELCDEECRRRRAEIEEATSDDEFTDWTISRECWDEIKKHLKPGMKTLETGCGLSTKLFIEAGCDHTALEDEEEFLVDGATLCEFDGWYQWKHDGPYDLIFIDGPRGEKGRDGILPHIHPGPPPNLTHSETVIVVDDTHRAPEAGIARSIGEILSGHTLHEYSNEDRSYTVIEPHA